MMTLATFLYWLVKSAIVTFWIFDIMNMPFMEMFDTVYPLNTLFWILMWVFVIEGFYIKCGGDNEKSKS